MDSVGYETDWTNPATGQNFPNAWIKPDPIFYRINAYTSCYANLWINEQAYLDGKNPIDNINTVVDFGSQDWNTYFDSDVLKELNKDFLSQWYIFLKTIYPENQ